MCEEMDTGESKQSHVWGVGVGTYEIRATGAANADAMG